MRKVVKLTESDLNRIVKRIINEQNNQNLVTAMYRIVYVNDMRRETVPDAIKTCTKFGIRPTTMSNEIAKNINKGITYKTGGFLGGTDEEGVYNQFNSIKSTQQFCEVAASYQQMFKESLWDAIDGDFDGNSLDFFAKKLYNLSLSEYKKMVPQTTPTPSK